MSGIYYVYEKPDGSLSYGTSLPDGCNAVGMSATEEGAQAIIASHGADA